MLISILVVGDFAKLFVAVFRHAGEVAMIGYYPTLGCKLRFQEIRSNSGHICGSVGMLWFSVGNHAPYGWVSTLQCHKESFEEKQQCFWHICGSLQGEVTVFCGPKQYVVGSFPTLQCYKENISCVLDTSVGHCQGKLQFPVSHHSPCWFSFQGTAEARRDGFGARRQWRGTFVRSIIPRLVTVLRF